MNSTFCSYCTARGNFSPCLCGFGSILACADKPVCASCQKAHAVFGKVFRALLKTKAASRSNSPRTKMLQILHETIVFRRSSIRQESFCLDSLRRTSPFDTDDGNFGRQVLNVAQSLPLNQDIAATLETKIAETAMVLGIERADEAWRKIVEKQDANKALEWFARVVEIASR